MPLSNRQRVNVSDAQKNQKAMTTELLEAVGLCGSLLKGGIFFCQSQTLHPMETRSRSRRIFRVHQVFSGSSAILRVGILERERERESCGVRDELGSSSAEMDALSSSTASNIKGRETSHVTTRSAQQPPAESRDGIDRHVVSKDEQAKPWKKKAERRRRKEGRSGRPRKEKEPTQ